MAALTAVFEASASPFAGFQESGIAAAQLARSTVNAGQVFAKRLAANLGKEGVAAAIKGMMLVAGAAAVPALAPLLPAAAGIMGQVSLAAVMAQVANVAGEAVGNAVVETLGADKKSAHTLKR